MKTLRWGILQALGLSVIAVGSTFTPGIVTAQVTSAVVRGRVLANGQPVPAGVQVVATNSATGFTKQSTTQQGGAYALIGLAPGIYQLKIEGEGFQETSRGVRVQIGQTIDLDLLAIPTTQAAQTVTDEVVVTAERLIDMRTSEVATNISVEQIESLPQGNRNFLNFAALAPGVRINDRDTEKTFQAGALGANAVNVYIDGVSYKNQVINGGVVGQDSSRGNPFPQNAVQEFRVITQNFKAEYEQASSAIITAKTKSGTNEFHGDTFIYWQDKGLVARDDFAQPGEPKAAYERKQYGLSFGGPIIKDKLHFFVAYEGNDQDRAERVTLGNPAAEPIFGQYQGSFVQPFREDLVFAKLDFQPSYNQTMDLSFSLRDESDIKDFSGQNSYEAANDIQNEVRTVKFGHTYDAESFTNEATLLYMKYEWHPTPVNYDLVGREYVGIIRIGGGSTKQNIGQEVITFKDDLTFTEFDWFGGHSLKTGLRISKVDYDVEKFQNANPLFRYRPEEGYAFPGEALYGVGDPDLSGETTQYGLYIQDDWSVTSRLTLNLGVRWDYDTDLLGKDYVTPEAIRAAASQYVPDRYFTDGNDRDSPTDLIQPRIGFSFDLFDDNRTVFFGGVGRYFDRVLYNEILDERFRLQWGVRRFQFSQDGLPRNGQPTIVWSDAYLSAAALDSLIASGVAPNPEIFLIDSKTRIPETIQASIGVRQRFGDDWLASLAFARNRSRHGFTYIFGNRNPDGLNGPLPDQGCCAPVSGGFGNILVSSDAKQTWYNGVYVTLEKAYTEASEWGMTLAYTYSEAEETGGDLFSLDYPLVSDYPRHPTNADERHRIVMTGIVGLPWDMKLSSTLTLGSGTGYTITDQSQGTGPGEIQYRYYTGRPEKHSFIIPDAFAYRSLDLRLEKSFEFGETQAFSLIGEVFNVFDYENYDPRSYNGNIPFGGAPNEAFGKPTDLIEPGRRFQVGVTYSF